MNTSTEFEKLVIVRHTLVPFRQNVMFLLQAQIVFGERRVNEEER